MSENSEAVDSAASDVDAPPSGDDAACAELFQPPPPQPECPLCYLPLVMQGIGGTYTTCCGNSICRSCLCQTKIARMDNERRWAERGQPNIPERCPFCRAFVVVPEREEKERFQKHLDANDPEAYMQVADDHKNTGEFDEWLVFATRAAELGCTRAYPNLAKGLAVKRLLCLIRGDEAGHEEITILRKKYLDIGARKGCDQCHHDLGAIQLECHNPALAYKHFCFAAELGYTESSKMLLKGFSDGHLNRDEYAETLRAYKTANDAIMTPDRRLAMTASKTYNKKYKIPEASEKMNEKWGLGEG